MAETDSRERDKLIYDVVLNRYDLEWKRTNDIDSKASGIVGFAGVLATLSAGISQFVLNHSFRSWLFMPSLLFILSVLFGLGGYGLGTFRTIEPDAFIRTFGDSDETEVRRTYVATISEMTMFNFQQNNAKVNWVRMSLTTLGIAISLFFIIAIISMMA